MSASAVVAAHADQTIKRVACVGGGVIGAGWVARIIENGIDVNLFDPASDAREKMQAVLDNADRAYAKLTMAQRPAKGQLHYCDSVAQAVSQAQWIIESVPERLELKQSVYREIEKNALHNAVRHHAL